MTTFAAPGLDAKAPDPGKHVNFTLGMVLGVDDLNQDFGYLSGRDRWLASDAIGYGTLVGLSVGRENTTRGPRITVSSGAAILPPGRLVCVKLAQCGYLNDWIAAHKKELPALVGSPLSSNISLYLTLCYRECPVDPVPIPGEPCRSESELMAPSRLADDFLLELRTTPPDQREEDLLREFVAWLHTLPVGGGGPFATVEQFATALRAAVQEGPQSPLASPLSSPGVHFVFGSPLSSVRLDPALTPSYLREAFRIWATEIRPRVHPACCVCEHGCSCGETNGPPPPDECLLLARVDLPVVNIGGGEWRVDDTGTIAIDESRRPVVVPLRLLQEWVTGSTAGPGSSPVAAGPSLAAAGIVGAGGTTAPVIGHPTVAVPGGSRILLQFDDYTPPDASFTYIVKAMPVAGVIQGTTIAFDSFAVDGALLSVTNGTNDIADAVLSSMQFMVEVSRVQA